MMKLDFPLLELPLARLKSYFIECLHGIWNARLDVNRCIDNTICSYTKDSGQL